MDGRDTNNADTGHCSEQEQRATGWKKTATATTHAAHQSRVAAEESEGTDDNEREQRTNDDPSGKIQ